MVRINAWLFGPEQSAIEDQELFLVEASLEPFIRAIFSYCNSFLITKKYNFGIFSLLCFVFQPCFN